METIVDKIRQKRLEWLGHLARMADNRMPKRVLFSWLSEPRLRCGAKKRWRDVIRKDLTYIGVNEDRWYEEATRSRTGWKAVCHSSVTAHQGETQEFQGH